MSDNDKTFKKNLPPMAPSYKTAKQLTPLRRKEIGRQIERGEFREGFSDTPEIKKSILGQVTTTKGPRTLEFLKKATIASSLGTAWGGSDGTVRQGPEIYSPLWLTSNTHLPRDRGTMNAWARAFFALNPIVNNALSLHSTYPISKMNIICKDPRVETFFGEMAEEMDLLNICTQISQEFFVIGEAFPMLDLDESSLKWKRCIIQNPDYVFVKRTAIPSEPEISLRPDAELKRLIAGNDTESRRIRDQLPQHILKYIKADKNIPLDNFYISHLARKISPYETRGTSMIAPCFKALMLYDKLRECKFAQADNMINPITLIKLGGNADAEYKVTEADLETWRQLLQEAQYDKDFKIITHGSVSIERVGAQTVLDIGADLDRLTKEIYIGLMVPQVIMESGDITYANGSLSLDVLRQRYMQFQNMLAKWIRTKVFAPIAQLHDFWEYGDGDKTLIVPDIEWNHMNLFDLTDYISQISLLATGENKLVSVNTLYRCLGLDYEKEQRKIKKENIDQAIMDKEKEMLAKMSLTELRAISDEDEIQDIPDSPVPGESPDEKAVPGEEPMGGIGDMGGMTGPAEMPTMEPPETAGPPTV